MFAAIGPRMANESMSQTESLVLGGASLGELCRRYQVKELSLFGSAARVEMRAESDIDLMVEFELGVRMGLVRFESFVEDLEALAGRKVDVVTDRKSVV